MARLLRIENCYHECPRCHYDGDVPSFYCQAVSDPNDPSYYRPVPSGRTEPPPWCPLEEATDAE